MIGMQFGRLAVLESAGRSKDGRDQWLCACECGNRTVVIGKNLRRNNTQSCGCFHRERSAESHRTHGLSRAEEFNTWVQMKQRCNNPRNRAYGNYGGRGIRVCERWQHSFDAFLEDMGPRPSSKHSIDRIDNDGNYEPGNCRWATRTEQTRNRRGTVTLTFCGESRSMAEWSQVVGIPYSALQFRISHGWTAERALTIPVRDAV